MLAAHREADGFPDFSRERVALGVVEEAAGEATVRFVGKKLPLEIAAREDEFRLLPVFAGCNRHLEALGQHLGRDVRPRVDGDGVDEIRRGLVADGVEQAVTARRLAVVAAKGPPRVEQQASFVGQRVFLGLLVGHALQVIARRRGEAELGADEVFEDRAIIAGDRAVRLVADDKLEIRRREIREKPVVGREALDRRHHDLRLGPILPLLFVDDRRDAVRREVGREVFLGLPLELQPVHEEEDAVGVLRA